MRHIILVLIAMLALGGLMPAVMAEPAKAVGLSDKYAPLASPAESSLLTTPSMADFLNDSWTPSSFVASPAETNENKMKNVSVNDSNYAIYDFLNGNNVQSTPVSPIFTAAAATKNQEIAWTGESIYQFLDPDWTPSVTAETFPQTAFKMHQMN